MLTSHPLELSKDQRVTRLGQVFTRTAVVDRMLALCRNSGRTLEPSCGDGAFLDRLPPDAVAIEIDPTVAPPAAIHADFFSYPDTEHFDTIIGNPPYVAAKEIDAGTRGKLDSELLDGRSNLYLHFIEKCVRHLNHGGELIFITPRDFIKLTAATRLNEWLLSQGSFTHFEETGDSSIFGAYVPNCAIWRFEKGRKTHELDDGRQVVCHHGQLSFPRVRYQLSLTSLFNVRVGAVSGADDVFVHPEGNVEMVCSTTIDTNLPRRVFYGVADHPHLLANKGRLLERRIKRFGEENWWHWGRGQPEGTGPRIYVNGKTRRRQPFFIHPCENYDGSIMALYPRHPGIDLQKAVELLNTAVDWEQMGFVCDGRFIFSQRSLQNAALPEAFEKLVDAINQFE